MDENIVKPAAGPNLRARPKNIWIKGGNTNNATPKPKTTYVNKEDERVVKNDTENK